MKNITLLMTVFISTLATFSLQPSAFSDVVLVRWFGHACFMLESSEGTKVLIDPFGDIGYTFPTTSPNIVTISHEHFDHNNTDSIQGNPEILRGLTRGVNDWNNIAKKINDFNIFNVPVYHDKTQGSQRGKNSVFIYDVDGLRFVHVGDLGHVLLDDQIKKIGKVDVLMIPVGGIYTIDGQEASKVVEQLNPKIVLPMHYKTPSLTFELNTIDAFLNGKENVKKVEGNTLGVDIKHMPAKQEIIVLDFE
ncbi:MAG TPA: MBL fold metallo-hydrolase [Candidatus Brocadiia bacterium]